MSLDSQLKCAIDDALAPVLKRLATLEMVVTIISNKLDDAQCRAALVKFCGLNDSEDDSEDAKVAAPDPVPVVAVNGFSWPPVAAMGGTPRTLDAILEYFRMLDPDKLLAERGTDDIARYVGKRRNLVYQCLRAHKEDFEHLQSGLWRLRQTPLEAAV